MLAGKRIAARFTIDGEACAGGMGTIYRAIDAHTGERVAVKVLRRSRAADARRFEREALALRALDHPRIVRYLDHGATEDGDPFLVMEWLEGEDLAKRLSQGPLEIADALALVRRIAEAHGGRAFAENRAEGGARVGFTVRSAPRRARPP